MAELERSWAGCASTGDDLADSTQTAETLRPELAAVRSQIEARPSPPGKDGPPEARPLPPSARLMALAAGLDGAIKSTDLGAGASADREDTVLRHSLFTKNLMERRLSPLLPELWRDLVTQVARRGPPHQLSGEEAALGQHQAAAGLDAARGRAHALRCPQIHHSRLTDRRRVSEPRRLPSFFERARSVAWVAPTVRRPLPPPRSSMAGLDALTCSSPMGGHRGGISKAIVLYSAVSALTLRRARATRAAMARLVWLTDGPTRRVAVLLCAITAVYAIDAALTETPECSSGASGAHRRQSFVASTAFATLLIGLLLTPFTPQAGNVPAATQAAASDAGAAQPISRHAPRWLSCRCG